MIEYTATCAIDEDDTVTAMRSENRVELEPSSRASVFLDPGPARTFARGILALADEIDGGEAEEARAIRVGDRVEIVRAERWSSAEEGRVGVVGTVDEDDDHLPYRVVDEHGVYIAWCAEVRRVDEPAEDAGPEPTPSPFARYVDEAKGLLEGTDHTATDVIILARELHESA
ncbi:hypothetical protein [Streptomyces longwoodensis]|uniref:hypothetical protein n=1 Tax=Streptomyces longwoodensis TaxID=68231 RepID=UPI0033CAABED